MENNNIPATPEASILKLLYTGYFVNNQPALIEEIPVRLPGDGVRVFAHHVTKEFQPTSGLDSVMLGRVVRLSIFGQVVTDRIQAALVRSLDGVQLSPQNDHPHITIATAAGVFPVESNKAIEEAYQNGTVEIFDEPVEIEATEGYSDGKEVYTS